MINCTCVEVGRFFFFFLSHHQKTYKRSRSVACIIGNANPFRFCGDRENIPFKRSLISASLSRKKVIVVDQNKKVLGGKNELL